MDSILKSLYVRLDSNADSLTANAIGQILVKIVYSGNGRITKNEIFGAYASLNETKKINEEEIGKILDSLVGSEIQKRGGCYYLSNSKLKKIQKAEKESKVRRTEILSQYFSKLHSEKEAVSEWLQDITIHFFMFFSDEWISDLVTGHHAVTHSESSIKDLVMKRTINNKKIDKRDWETLPKRFFEFVNDNKTIVDDYLWEYGTSAFAAKLIKNKYGVNAITLEAFKNSRCILDTNILLFIALDSHYRDGIVALEKVFADLNIEVGYLYITKKEYQDKVLGQKRITKHNLEKYGYEIASIPNDDFTTCAKELKCKTEEDFDRFFDEKYEIPAYLHDVWPIKLFDNNQELVAIIDEAQADENKKNELNKLYRNIKGRDKRPNALLHDIGLLEGVEHLRKSSKHFIISEETCINAFSKQRPTVENLPLAIRISTLINVLAVNNGGETFDATNYVPLFANIIRSGLIPSVKTFGQEELYDLYDMDEQIAQLPEAEVKDIVLQMHDLMMQGIEEKELRRTLKTLITKGKIKVVSDLDSTKEELSFYRKEVERQKTIHENTMHMLQAKIREEEEEKYDKITRSIKWTYKLYIPLAVFVVSTILVILSFFNTSFIDSFLSVMLAIVANILTNIITNVFVLRKKLADRKRNKKMSIDGIVLLKIKKYMNTTK